MELVPKQPDNGCEDDVIYLEEYFFINKKVMKRNDELVQRTFNNFYKYVNYN